MRRYQIVLLAFVLSACSVTEPVAVIGANGEILRGSTTASMMGGEVTVSSETRTCKGKYDIQHKSLTISFPVQCNDGHKGIAIVTRDLKGMSGSGRIRMDDGTEADFVFGKAAEGI